MVLTYKLEWYGEEGLAARNKEWQRREKLRKELEAKKEVIPIELLAHPYTEAHRVGDFWHMVYGLYWEQKNS